MPTPGPAPAPSPHAPAPLMEACAARPPALYDHLEEVVHSHALQSLSVCRLQVELCQSLWSAGEPEQAFAELQVLVQEVESAVQALRHIVGHLSLARREAPDPA